MLCGIWYHLYNFKNVIKAHGKVSPLVKLQASALLHGCFPLFKNRTNETKSRKVSQIYCSGTSHPNEIKYKVVFQIERKNYIIQKNYKPIKRKRQTKRAKSMVKI